MHAISNKVIPSSEDHTIGHKETSNSHARPTKCRHRQRVKPRKALNINVKLLARHHLFGENRLHLHEISSSNQLVAKVKLGVVGNRSVHPRLVQKVSHDYSPSLFWGSTFTTAAASIAPNWASTLSAPLKVPSLNLHSWRLSIAPAAMMFSR